MCLDPPWFYSDASPSHRTIPAPKPPPSLFELGAGSWGRGKPLHLPPLDLSWILLSSLSLLLLLLLFSWSPWRIISLYALTCIRWHKDFLISLSPPNDFNSGFPDEFIDIGFVFFWNDILFILFFHRQNHMIISWIELLMDSCELFSRCKTSSRWSREFFFIIFLVGLIIVLLDVYYFPSFRVLGYLQARRRIKRGTLSNNNSLNNCEQTQNPMSNCDWGFEEAILIDTRNWCTVAQQVDASISGINTS